MINNSILVENKADNIETNNTTEKMYSLLSDGAEKMNTLESNHTCGDCIIARKENVINSVYGRITYKMVVLFCTIN